VLVPTLFLGNPPYVRHHHIAAKGKDWLRRAAREQGLPASGLAGLHAHFFLATARHALGSLDRIWHAGATVLSFKMEIVGSFVLLLLLVLIPLTFFAEEKVTLIRVRFGRGLFVATTGRVPSAFSAIADKRINTGTAGSDN